MSRPHDDWDYLLKVLNASSQQTIKKLQESTRVVEACTQEIKEQNRKARFIARCLGLSI